MGGWLRVRFFGRVRRAAGLGCSSISISALMRLFLKAGTCGCVSVLVEVAMILVGAQLQQGEVIKAERAAPCATEW